jgi:RimJ/RimL family protein N-acetyltransferase
VDLRPLNPSDDELLSALEQQEDVWEFVGTLPLPDDEHPHHLFAIIEGGASVGVAGLVRSQALEGTDFELLCALRSEAQGRGFAKQACQLVLAWAFDTAKLERVIACIGDGNDGARAIAAKLGMTELGGGGPPGTTVYVKDRGKRKTPVQAGSQP